MYLKENFNYHETLNPKIWANNKLIPEVRTRVLDIAQEFISGFEIPFSLVDIHIVGSQASYNYTDYSDLDVHLITNFETMNASPEMCQVVFNSLKAKFNADYDITIKGIDVELYVEDIKSTVLSNGIYSVLSDSWIKFPQKLTTVLPANIDTNKYDYLVSSANKAIESRDSEAISNIIDDIYLIRKISLDTEGEFGQGNFLFKQLRNDGVLDSLKKAYKAARSSELTLEKYKLNEDSRSSLLSKSKKSVKGFQRFKRRVKSRVANSVKQYNSIDMNKLFKQDILTVDIEVKGETDTYQVKISFGGFLEILKDQIERHGEFNLKAVTRALITGFNRDDVYIHCSCPDWQYRFSYFATKNNITSGDPENRPSDITNPDDKLGVGCKHVLLVLSNTSWILKVASTIFNYVNYMEKHYERLYSKIIYPAIFGKAYEKPVQLDIFDDDEMSTDTDTIKASNAEARNRNKFQTGNTYGVRFAPKSKPEDPQLDIDDTEEN